MIVLLEHTTHSLTTFSLTHMSTCRIFVFFPLPPESTSSCRETTGMLLFTITRTKERPNHNKTSSYDQEHTVLLLMCTAVSDVGGRENSPREGMAERWKQVRTPSMNTPRPSKPPPPTTKN